VPAGQGAHAPSATPWRAGLRGRLARPPHERHLQSPDPAGFWSVLPSSPTAQNFSIQPNQPLPTPHPTPPPTPPLESPNANKRTCHIHSAVGPSDAPGAKASPKVPRKMPRARSGGQSGPPHVGAAAAPGGPQQGDLQIPSRQ
jgi:hypothetical protein